MSDTKISALPLATSPLTGAELLPLVQAGASVRAPVSAINFGLTAPTYAAARLLAGVTTGDRLQVLGRTTQSDGGQGLFTWVAGGSTTVNDGFELSAPGGIWRRADMSFVTYEMFGAVPMTSFADVSHDSTAAIAACHAAIPGISVARLPFKIRLQGFYGISDTINFDTLVGTVFVGVANFAELGSGYIWIAAQNPVKHALFFRQCRRLRFKGIRIACNTTQALRANAMLSAICLSSDYITGIQERCTFEDVVIGNRDGLDGLSPTGYEFQYGITTETITGTVGNNDFHLFESVLAQGVGVGFNNQHLQATGWVLRNCKVWVSDSFLSTTSTQMTIINMEGNHLNAAQLILGQVASSDTNHIRVSGVIGQTNFAEFAIITGLCDLTVEKGGFDTNRNPANLNVVNPANPYFITVTSSNTAVITLVDPSFLGPVPPQIDFGTGSALMQLNVKGASPTSIAIVNHSNNTQSQRIVYNWAPGGGRLSTWALAAQDWSPIENVIFPPYSTVPDPTTNEIATPTVRLGRRNASACVDVKNVVTASGNITSGATFTFTGAIPAGVLLLGVSFSVDGTFTGCTNFSIGDGVTAARWGTHENASASTHIPTPEGSLIATYTDASPIYIKAATNVVLTANGSNFTGGRGFLTVHYIDFAQRYYNPNSAA